MQPIGNDNFIYAYFKKLPEGEQNRILSLIQKVNEQHLHCEDAPTWTKAHYLITNCFALYFFDKQEKHVAKTQAQVAVPQKNDKDQIVRAPARQFSSMMALNQFDYDLLINGTKKPLEKIFHDTIFTNSILEALQQHILLPLSRNAELAHFLCVWIGQNAMYLPLGTHLLNAYKADMDGTSEFSKYVLKSRKIVILSEAASQETIAQMEAFLAEAAKAHGRRCTPTPQRSAQPTAVMLSVKNGAGGHTAPTQAMAARLKEKGWRVETIHYDTDLLEDFDSLQLLGITFADGTPMTEAAYITRWKMQKQNREVARVVKFYRNARRILDPDLFVDNSGGDLLRNKILPLNPHLIITTLAYHWSWKAIAYRVAGAKTLLVASDVFFHTEALYPWFRQQAIDPKLRQMHFTTMTDDMELLCSYSKHHQDYIANNYPDKSFVGLAPFYKGLRLDSQISVIGAPIHPAFNAITDSSEIMRLRNKWRVPEGAISVCISRGKLGYDSDLIPALESYRTDQMLPQPVVIHVVCGENIVFYNRLVDGEYGNLGPNINIIPYPLLAPPDFAELRAISTLDDIKAGGGSTFEGWYLISKGTKSMLLLTPGPDLFWENSNCDAMEKWGIGRTIAATTSKIEILMQVMKEGLPNITNRFPDWKPLFDKAVEKLL